MKNRLYKTICSFSLALLCNNILNAQLNEKFSDGDFSANPVWVGNTTDFIVNASGQLQSKNVTANSTFYLSTANTLATNVQWEFFVKLAFSTSGANYTDVYLTASQSNLLQAANTGYFVRVGNTDDEVSLYRKDAGGTSVKIIDGVNGSVGASNNSLKIKVIRGAANQWGLSRDNTATGNNYISEGTVTDATYTTAAFFGILVKQSTASFFQKHFFDDIVISSYVPDIIPPSILSATATSINTVDILFSEPVDASAANINNYVAASLGKPAAVIIGSNPALVTLSFATNFTSGVVYTLAINGVKDLAGNTLTNGSSVFSFFVIGKYSIVIDEIMADPLPQVGLPNAEWIELRNTSPVAINLLNYRVGKTGSSTSGPMPAFILQPDSFVIVATASQVAALSAYGRTISVTSFPSLNVTGASIFLQTNTGTIMHYVSYSPDWYQNVVKANGGWTLEMIDSRNPCAGANNWKASANTIGGTPGKKNSIDAANADTEAPRLLRAYATDNLNLILFFDEPLDSAKASLPSAYTISDGIAAPATATAQEPNYNRVNLTLNTPLVPGKIYTVTAESLTDCSGNIIGNNNTAKVGLSSDADSLDLVINEILFNPQPFGVDYLEIYNRSNKIIDLSGISVANRSSTTGAIGSPVNISTDNYLLFPAEFIALTPDPSIVKQQYVPKNPDAFIAVPLPSFPDTKGTVVVLNNQGNIVDELSYDAKWHFALLDNEQGVSLERIDYNKATNQSSNWTSAASTTGFGTPGYQNSQFRADLTPQGTITINPKMFSPDNDGFEDFALIEFVFPEPGYVANVSIYDAAGRPVKLLQRNTTTAAKGNFRWDGLNDKLQRVPAGTYIIYTDIFNLKGQKKQYKNTVVVATKF